MSNPYGAKPKPGHVFPSHSHPGAVFVAVDRDYDLLAAAQLAVVYELGMNKATPERLDHAVANAEEWTLFRVLAEQGTINDCEPGMWHSDGQGVALDAIFFPEEAFYE